MHQIHFLLRLCPDPSGGAYSAPRPLPLFKGPTSKGMEGNGRGEEKEGERCSGFGPPTNFCVAPPMAGTLGNGVPKVILTVGTAGELYKKHSVCSKLRLFKIQNRKMFLEGAQHPSQTPPYREKGQPSSRPTPSAPRSSRLRRSNSAFPEFFIGNDP